MIDVHDVIACHNGNGVVLMQRIPTEHGDGARTIFDGRLSPSEAVVLAGSLLKAAGGVLTLQGAAMRMERQTPKPRRKQQDGNATAAKGKSNG